MPEIERADLQRMALLIILSLALFVGTAAGVAHSTGVPLGELGVYHDGHIYLEIAKSFPRPYAPEGPDYWGCAPGYPAVAYVLRGVLPDRFMSWGWVMLLASWIPAALCTAAFYLLCKQTGTRPFWPSVLFLVGNPRWIALGATAHPEALAMLFAILSLVAYLRDRMGWCVVLLVPVVLTRYPALLLGLPLAFGVLGLRKQIGVRNLALLSVPLLALGVLHIYLFAHLPDFEGIARSHQIFWPFQLTWPFAGFVEHPTGAGGLPWSHLLLGVTYSSAVLYVLAIGIGLRKSERDLWILPLWVAVLVLFHASLSGAIVVAAFTRIVILAWPAALLILWRTIAPRLPTPAAAALCAACAVVGLSFANGYLSEMVEWQRGNQPFIRETIERLDTNEAHWTDFQKIVRDEIIERNRRGRLAR